MLKLFNRANRIAGWLAVSLSENGIAYAHVEHTPLTKPKVKLCEFKPLTEVDAETLRKLCNTANLGRYRCTHVLSVEEYKLLCVDSPKVPAAELKQAIRWQVKNMLDFPVEQATIDAFEIPAREGGQQNSLMYAIAAPNTVISQRMSLYNAAKLKLQVIDIPEMAQRNLAGFVEQHARALALLSFNPAGDDCLLTFTADGELYQTRRIEVSQQQILEPDEVRQQQFLERLVLELQRSLDHFDRQYHSLSLSELKLAPFSGAAELQRYLTQNLDVGVSVMNLNDALDLSAVPDLVDDFESQGKFFLLLGAALREIQEMAA